MVRIELVLVVSSFGGRRRIGGLGRGWWSWLHVFARFAPVETRIVVLTTVSSDEVDCAIFETFDRVGSRSLDECSSHLCWRCVTPRRKR